MNICVYGAASSKIDDSFKEAGIKLGKKMAKNISSKKPLSIKLSSHANNKTNSKQKPNLQTYTINGVKVRLTAREARVFKKAAK